MLSLQHGKDIGYSLGVGEAQSPVTVLGRGEDAREGGEKQGGVSVMLARGEVGQIVVRASDVVNVQWGGVSAMEAYA
jgi:hypothetical protein